MGCSREGFDLFTKHGRKSFLRDLLKYHYVNSYMWRDTFGQILCKIIGHNAYADHTSIPPDYVCKRCSKFITEVEFNKIKG